jgi:penicillin-binding protein 1C
VIAGISRIFFNSKPFSLFSSSFTKRETYDFSQSGLTVIEAVFPEVLIGEEAGIYNGTLPKLENHFVLPPNFEYWHKTNSLNYRVLPDFVPWHKATSKENISIVFPEPSARIIIPVELDGTPGAMVAQAAARSAETIIYWDLDGNYLGLTEKRHEIVINPNPGAHVLTITDNNGNMLRRTFEILEHE